MTGGKTANSSITGLFHLITTNSCKMERNSVFPIQPGKLSETFLTFSNLFPSFPNKPFFLKKRIPEKRVGLSKMERQISLKKLSTLKWTCYPRMELPGQSTLFHTTVLQPTFSELLFYWNAATVCLLCLLPQIVYLQILIKKKNAKAWVQIRNGS